MASLTRSRSIPTDIANDLNVEYYRQRAEGGAGLIISESTLVSPQGVEWPHVANIYSLAHVAGWRKVNDAVHDAGGRSCAQLWHAGRIAHPGMLEGGCEVWGPLPVAARGGNFRKLGGAKNVVPREIEDPLDFIVEFEQGAKYAKEAGFDGVELHAANGFLPQQFLDKGSNRRTDEWGGSVENRARFTGECLATLVNVWGADRVGIKLNPCGGYNDVGMNEADTLDTYSYVISQAVRMNLAYIQLARYSPFLEEIFDGVPRAQTHLDVLAFDSLIHTPGSTTALFLNGDLTPSSANSLAADGKVDGAVFGREFINNPVFPKRVLAGMKMNEELGFPIDWTTLDEFDEEDPRRGYTDYPKIRSLGLVPRTE